jgi:hypothetical protein
MAHAVLGGRAMPGLLYAEASFVRFSKRDGARSRWLQMLSIREPVGAIQGLWHKYRATSSNAPWPPEAADLVSSPFLPFALQATSLIQSPGYEMDKRVDKHRSSQANLLFIMNFLEKVGAPRRTRTGTSCDGGF